MGAPYSVKPDSDYYLHPVALRGYCLDETEVTVAAYRACAVRDACDPPHVNQFSCTYEMRLRDNHPVNCLDWYQADRACRAFGKRLPTEQEWEYAARGGSEQRVYSWGNLPPSSELSCYNHPSTCAVRSFPPGAFGLHDMTGNVWEWTASLFTKRAGWLPVGEWRVYRGGSYSRRFPKWMKTWVRNRFRPEEWGAHLGFRCAVDLPDAPCPQGTTPLDGTTQCQIPGEPSPILAPLAMPSPAPGPAPVEQLPPPRISRDPQFDEDCARHKPDKPSAYLVKGSSFAERQKSRRERRCTNRDVGPDFNSVCCP
jgi:hypothetical protein